MLRNHTLWCFFYVSWYFLELAENNTNRINKCRFQSVLSALLKYNKMFLRCLYVNVLRCLCVKMLCVYMCFDKTFVKKRLHLTWTFNTDEILKHIYWKWYTEEKIVYFVINIPRFISVLIFSRPCRVQMRLIKSKSVSQFFYWDQSILIVVFIVWFLPFNTNSTYIYTCAYLLYDIFSSINKLMI